MNLGSDDAALSHSTSNCHLSTSSMVSSDVTTKTIFCIVLDISHTVKEESNK